MPLSRLAGWTRRVVVIAVVVLGAAGLGQANACDTPCTYRKITTMVCVQEPYRACVTRYDHCGRPYHAYVTKYRAVHVPVVKWVKVCY